MYLQIYYVSRALGRECRDCIGRFMQRAVVCVRTPYAKGTVELDQYGGPKQTGAAAAWATDLFTQVAGYYDA